jgi:two-component system cell cycle response regulator DivK
MAECKYGASGNASERNSRYLLIVDSDANELYYTAMLLQRFEYNICTAGNADEAIEMVSVALPTLIISELSLTGRNGHELIQQLKENPRTASVPVVIKAFDPSPEVERKCLQAGAALIRRPVQAEDLYRIVQLTIENTPRGDIRVYTRLPVMVNNKPLDCGGENECATVLSQHGMYVRTLKPCLVGSKLSLQIVVKGRSIALDAVVLYSHRFGEGPFKEPGMGLKFISIAPKDQDFIRQFIREEVTKGINPI